MGWLEKFLNVPEHKLAIGVNPNHNFTACDLGVFDAFTKSGEPAKNTASLLPELVDAGIRLLVYAGDAGEDREGVLLLLLVSSLV